MLAQWNLDLGRTVAERRIALRLARERAALVSDLATDDEQQARVFIEQLRAAQSPSSPTSQSRASEDDVDDDLDAFDDEDDDIDDETYYAEAFED
jgi:hypothetical protein